MNSETLSKISSLASRDAFYLGWHLARYSEKKGVSMEELGRELGCLPETVNSIALCRAPRAEPPHFQRDIERVAERFQIRADRLMGIVRLAQVSGEESMLMAARDRNLREDEESGPDG